MSIDINIRTNDFQTLVTFCNLRDTLLSIPFHAVCHGVGCLNTTCDAGLARCTETDLGHQVGTHTNINRHRTDHERIFGFENILLQSPFLLPFNRTGDKVLHYQLHVESALESNLQVLQVAHAYLLPFYIAKVEREQALQTDIEVQLVPGECAFGATIPEQPAIIIVFPIDKFILESLWCSCTTPQRFVGIVYLYIFFASEHLNLCGQIGAHVVIGTTCVGCPLCSQIKLGSFEQVTHHTLPGCKGHRLAACRLLYIVNHTDHIISVLGQ